MSAQPDFNPTSSGAALPDLELLRLALEQQPDDFAILSTDYTVQWLAPRFAARLGVEAAQANGRSWFDLHPLAASRAVAYECALGGEPMNLQTRPLISAGAVRYFITRLQPLVSANRVRGLLVIEQDVTGSYMGPDIDARRIAMVRTMAEGSPEVVSLLDANGKVMFVSDSLVNMLGYQPNDLVGRAVFEIIHPEDLPDLRARVASGSLLNDPLRVQRYRARQRHADGSWRCIESLAVNALLDPLVASIIVYSKDVTEAAALEDLLARRERRFTALAEKSDDLIVVLDSCFRVSFESASTMRVLGHRPRQLAGAHILKLVHPEHRRDVLRIVRDLLAHHGSERRFTFMIRAYDGAYRWLEAVATDLIDDPDVAGMLINARDITARKMLEIEHTFALDGGDVALWDQDLDSRQIRWLSCGGPQHLFANLTEHGGEAEWINNIHPGDRARVLGAFQQLEAGFSDRAHVEYRLRIHDGSYRWILERARFGGISPDTGSRRTTGMTLDVTERHKAEHALSATRERFTLALDCAQIGFYERDIACDVIEGLDSWCDTVGLPACSGQRGHNARWLQWVHPDDRDAAISIFAAHMAGESAFAEAEYRMRSNAAQPWIWILDRAQVTARDAAGRALRIAGVVMDIDRRKNMELAFSDTRSRLSTAIWGANFGLWECELPQMNATWFSDWCREEGIAPCAGPNHVETWDANIHPDDLPAAEALFSRMLEGEVDAYEAEYRVRTIAGDWRWIFERSRAVQRDSSGRPTRVVGICMNIDARKRAEEALRRSEFRYRTVTDLTPGYVAEYAFDAEHNPHLVWASDGFAQVFGRTIDEFESMTWDDVYADDEQCRLGHKRAAELRRGQYTGGEARILHRDGTPRWLYISTCPLTDDATGRITGALGVVHDITERKLAENALLESQLQLRSIADNSPDWLMLFDTELRIQFANRMVRGVRAEQLIGRRLSEILALPLAQELERRLHAVMADGAPVEFEHPYTGLDQAPRFLLERARAVRVDGQVVGAVVICSDVSERVRQQSQLRMQAHILATMREGVVLLDGNNRIRITNPSFDAMFGSTGGSLIDQPFEMLLPNGTDIRAGRVVELRRELERARSAPLEFMCQRLDGTPFAAAGLATPTVIGGTEHLLLVLSDVSERKVLEREILEVSNREQQRIGADLHDGLGQELTGVALMLRGLSARIRKDYPNANAGIDEIVALVNHAIQVTRMLAHGLSPVSIERGGLIPALRTLAARASETYGIAVTLRTRMLVEARIEETAANHLHRIVQEALSNAMRHGHARSVKIHLASDAKFIRLSIRDDGRGIHRGDSDRRGLGLRTMSYRAQLIGGRLEVAAHPQGGTVVRCICPQGARVQPAVAGPAAISRESAP